MGVHIGRPQAQRLGFATVAGGASLMAAIGLASVLTTRPRAHADDVRALVEYVRDYHVDPLTLILSGARSHRIVFLGDVHPSAEPKRIAAEAIERLARGPGLEAVVLEVGSDQQPHIDRYLATDPEDVSILLANPRTLRGHWGLSREYLEIYRRVWRLNRALGPTRQIRIVAADLPGWPPERPLPPHVAAARYAERDAHMAEIVTTRVLDRHPTARALIFMGGYHGLKSGSAELRFGGGPPATVTWLAARLRERYPTEVFTVVADGAPYPSAHGELSSFGVTRVFDLFRRNGPRAATPFAVLVNDRFDFLRKPIYESAGAGVTLELRPDGYRLRDLIDGYIYLGVARGIDRIR